MDPLTIIILAVGIAAVTAPIGVRMFPVCAPTRHKQLTGSRGLDWTPPPYLPAVQADTKAHERTNDPAVTVPWRPAGNRSLADYHKRTDPARTTHWEPNRATQALMDQLEEEQELEYRHR